jgi:ribosome-associated toxin RatA of RatAB toxin-antitoxin module
MSDHLFQTTVDIEAPPDRVFAVVADVERWPEWTASVTKIVRLSKGPLGVGSRLRIHQPKLPPAYWRVVAVDSGRGFTSVSGAPGMRVTAVHSVEPRAAGSRVTLSIRYSGMFAAALVWLTRDVNDRYLALEANGLKSRCERHAV